MLPENVKTGSLKKPEAGKDEEKNNQHGIVERKYPEDPTHVEVSEVTRAVPGIVENTRDKEPRENKKQVNTVKAIARDKNNDTL
jgi:hypothetical protein